MPSKSAEHNAITCLGEAPSHPKALNTCTSQKSVPTFALILSLAGGRGRRLHRKAERLRSSLDAHKVNHKNRTLTWLHAVLLVTLANQSPTS